MKRKLPLILSIALVLCLVLAACGPTQNADGTPTPGGAQKYTVTFVVDGKETKAEAADGSVALPADPVKDGFTFTGWFTAAEGGQPFTGSGVTGDMSVYAQFEEVKTVGFDYDWEEEDWDGSRPFEDGEGNNFLLKDGKAHTINDSGKIGPCDSWSFTYTPYDLEIGECTVEAKVNCLGTKAEGTQGVFSIRHMYATNYDVQLNFATETSPSAVYLYNVNNGAVIASSLDPANGGQLSGSNIAMNEDHVVKLVYQYNDDETTEFFVYVDDVLEIYLPALPKQSPSAKFGFGASSGTNLEVDYFKCYPTEGGHTPVIGAVNLVKGWEFNEDSVIKGSELEGMDAYTEGLALYTNGEGQLQSVSSVDGGVTFGPSSWSSIRTGYDMGIPMNYMLQVRVKGISPEGESGETTALAALRPSHAQWGDIHISMSSAPGNGGIYFYKSGAGWFDKGGLDISMDQWHTVSILYQQTKEGAGDGDWGVYTISAYVDGQLVLRNKEAESFGPNMSVGLFAGSGNVQFDYFRIYGIE